MTAASKRRASLNSQSNHEAMAGRYGEDLDFEFDADEMRPHIHSRCCCAGRLRRRPIRYRCRRNDAGLIILPFAQRYGIWEPDDAI